MTINRAALLASIAPVAFDTGMATTPEAVQAAKKNYTANETDPVLKRSADSAAMIDYWDLTDTIVDGIAALRLAGDRYLPKFMDEQEPEYSFRLKMTKLTNVYRDTLEGLASKPFEEEIDLIADENKSIPPTIEEFAENVDGSGNNLTMFAGATFFNGINSAIDWICVDFPKPDPSVRSVADAKAAGLRPYWSHVLGRNVLDVRSKMIGGNEMITYVRVYEPGTPDKVRVFMREPTGAIRWALFAKTAAEHDVPLEWLPGLIVGTAKTKFTIEDEGTLTINVIPMVPFVTARRDGRTWKLFPALRDAADLQVELYQQESGLKFAKTLTAYPMLAANGIRPALDEAGNVKRIAVGPNRVLYAAPDGSGHIGKWEYIEPSAASLKFLADDIKETINQLRELGRQPLTAQSGNLTVITTAVAAGKAKSAVKAWGLGLKDALENALVITCKWMNITPETYDPTVAVYLEFDEFMEGKDLDALNTARTNKDISQLTYWDELQRRAVLSPEFDAETETQRLLDELPGDGVDTTVDDNPPPVDDPNAPGNEP